MGLMGVEMDGTSPLLRLRSSVTTDMADATARTAEKVRADLKNIIFADWVCLFCLLAWVNGGDNVLMDGWMD